MSFMARNTKMQERRFEMLAIAMLIIGLAVGFFVGAMSSTSAHKRSVRRGVIEYEGVVYRLTEIKP